MSPNRFRCRSTKTLFMLLFVTLSGITLSSYADDDEKESKMRQSMKLIKQGRHIFRHDTFGNEPFWGGQLRLHEAIAGEANGGVGPGVSPNTALALGLKVDVKALPKSLRKQLKQGKVDLDSAATTLALLQLDAIIGVKGRFDESGQIRSMGITCALCHTQVDDSFAAGIDIWDIWGQSKNS